MAVRDLAVRRFALSRLVAIIHPDHIASRRVAENIGMHAEKTTILDDYLAVIYATGRPAAQAP
jgi:RimJ/RimL family protein N-acetyltransferase